ncbi:MAG TPA: hypothetical protein VHP31_00145 [Caproicibacter sp.]|nr:hypothetical protein [Caproicibacter sp.]
MLEQIAAYLEKLGYTTEEQGSIEKYLVVFKDGKPLGFILSDCSVRVVSDAEGTGDVEEAIGFLQKNRDLQSVGNGEFLLAHYRKDQMTTFFDVKNHLVRYAVYLVDGNTGEADSTIFESYDAAAYCFVTQSRMIDLNRYLPRQKHLSERIREKLLHYLLSKSNHEPERL